MNKNDNNSNTINAITTNNDRKNTNNNTTAVITILLITKLIEINRTIASITVAAMYSTTSIIVMHCNTDKAWTENRRSFARSDDSVNNSQNTINKNH